MEDPKIEAFVYNRFLFKSQVTLPQSASIECKDHGLEKKIDVSCGNNFTPNPTLFP